MNDITISTAHRYKAKRVRAWLSAHYDGSALPSAIQCADAVIFLRNRSTRVGGARHEYSIVPTERHRPFAWASL